LENFIGTSDVFSGIWVKEEQSILQRIPYLTVTVPQKKNQKNIYLVWDCLIL